MLRILPPKPIGYCMPWHARHVEPGASVHGGRCCFCDREIAVPAEWNGKNVGCIYCGLDNGDLPEIELKP